MTLEDARFDMDIPAGREIGPGGKAAGEIRRGAAAAAILSDDATMHAEFTTGLDGCGLDGAGDDDSSAGLELGVLPNRAPDVNITGEVDRAGDDVAIFLDAHDRNLFFGGHGANLLSSAPDRASRVPIRPPWLLPMSDSPFR